ncbi:hypothetical protein [Streptomyces sp. NPDC005423]|uniref:hypothetical protein n=1 Tax=Streptomyces sp. NPDC005423 TaxID=3155343 RepID=UPI0033BB6257
MVTEVPDRSAPAVAPGGLPALADALRGDATRMEEYAHTLRTTARALGALDDPPEWSGPVLEQQASACLVAAGQLRAAAIAMDAHARAARPRALPG